MKIGKRAAARAATNERTEITNDLWDEHELEHFARRRRRRIVRGWDGRDLNAKDADEDEMEKGKTDEQERRFNRLLLGLGALAS